MYTIGEFAKLSNTTIQTLRHYDAIDLLNPCEINKDNGYRLYSISQLDQMNTIQLLKSSGYKLSSIKAFFEQYEPEVFVKLLDNKINSIDEEIYRLKKLKIYLKRKSETIKYGLLDEGLSDYQIKEFPERFAHCESIEGLDINNDFTIIRNKLLGNDVNNAHHFSFAGLMLPKEKFLKNLIEDFSHLVVLSERYKEGMLILEAGNYLTIKHKGSYKSILLTYSKLLDHIKENHYEVLASPFEIGIVDTLITKDEEKYITEIQVLIK